MRSLLRTAFTGSGATARIACAALVVATLTVQHPNTNFDRTSRRDKFAVLPNWRFFAPTPAMHDFHFLYRTLREDGRTSSWKGVDVIEGRKLHQIVWFPTRRPEKAVYDICSELLPHLAGDVAAIRNAPAYDLVTAYLDGRIRREGAQDVKGFQFALTQSTGFDTVQEPELLFVSPYTPLIAPDEEPRDGSPGEGRAA